MLRSFQTYQPFRGLDPRPFDGPTGSCLLGKKTVIYGRNGAGKTSLSEVLRLAGSSGQSESVNGEASLRLSGSNQKQTFDVMQATVAAMVYNKYYVDQSLRVFLSGSGVSEPILKLGQVSVLAEQQLVQAQADIQRLVARSDAVKQKQKSLAENEKAAIAIAKSEVISKLSAGDGSRFNTAAYRTDMIKKHLADITLVKLSDGALATEESAANSDVLSQVAVLPPLGDSGAVVEHVKEIVRRRVDSVPDPFLRGSQTLANWVEEGLVHHSPGETCKFCRRGTVDEQVLKAYQAHFSAELHQLRANLQIAITDLKTLRDIAEKQLLALPRVSDLIVDLREEYGLACDRLVPEMQQFRTQVAILLEVLGGRLADPLALYPTDAIDFDRLLVPDFLAVKATLLAHNAACSGQFVRKRSAQKRVELHVGAVYGPSYRDTVHRQVLAAKALFVISQRSERLNLDVEHLRQSQQDTGRMARQIDNDLSEHFGHGHLRVSVSSDRTGYIVTRNGVAATFLSEGERNAIAFCYFLATLQGEGVDKASTIVVVDDPVTSLDKEALFAAFALAEERTKDFAQTIFLTHDYEYFRLQLNQRRSSLEKSRELVEAGDSNEIAFPKVSILEVYASIDTVASVRISRLRALSPQLLKHGSEYHYLFFKVANAVCVGAAEELPLLGNAARRLLEGFLTFRVPHGASFQAKVDHVCRTRSVPGELSRRIVKFAHGHSHREEPSPSTALDFPSVEAELGAVLKFLFLSDEEHVENMCKAVGVEVATLRASVSS